MTNLFPMILQGIIESHLTLLLSCSCTKTDANFSLEGTSGTKSRKCHLVTRWAIPPPIPPLTMRHRRSGRQAAMPTPPVQSRRSKEQSGLQGLAATALPPSGKPASLSSVHRPSIPSPGLRYTILQTRNPKANVQTSRRLRLHVRR